LLEHLKCILFDLLAYFQSIVEIDVLLIALQTLLVVEHRKQFTVWALKNVNSITFEFLFFSEKILDNFRRTLFVFEAKIANVEVRNYSFA